MPRCFHHAVVGLGLLALSACSVQHHNLSQGSVQQSTFRYNWGKPAEGMYRCLSVRPGTPVRASTSSQIIGYTRDVVAFYGWQEGDHITVIYYNGALGWIDLNVAQARPYQGNHPGASCVIPGVDIRQRPIFVIR